MGSKKTKDNAEPQGVFVPFEIPKRPSGVPKSPFEDLTKALKDLVQNAQDAVFARSLNKEGAPATEADSRPFLMVGKGGKAIRTAVNNSKGKAGESKKSYSNAVRGGLASSSSSGSHAATRPGPSQAGVKPASSTGAGSGPRQAGRALPRAVPVVVDLTKDEDSEEDRRLLALKGLRKRQQETQKVLRVLANLKVDSSSLDEIARMDMECVAELERAHGEMLIVHEVFEARKAAEAKARALAALSPMAAAKAKMADAEAQGELLKKELLELEAGDESHRVSLITEQTRLKNLDNKVMQDRIDARRKVGGASCIVPTTAKKSEETLVASQGPVGSSSSFSEPSGGSAGISVMGLSTFVEAAIGDGSLAAAANEKAVVMASDPPLTFAGSVGQNPPLIFSRSVGNMDSAARGVGVAVTATAALGKAPGIESVSAAGAATFAMGEAPGISTAAASVASPVTAGLASTGAAPDAGEHVSAETAAAASAGAVTQMPTVTAPRSTSTLSGLASHGGSGTPGKAGGVAHSWLSAGSVAAAPAASATMAPQAFAPVARTTSSVSGRVQPSSDGPSVGLRSKSVKGTASTRSAPGSDDDDDPDPGSNAALRN